MRVNPKIQAGSRRALALILRIDLLAAAFLVVTAVPAVGQTTASIGNRMIGNHPAEMEKRRPVGRAVAHRQLRMRITFAISNRPALDRLLSEQRDFGSPNYRHWLTPGEFAKRFGVRRSDFDAVSTWLRSRGFKIVSARLVRRYIEFTGPVSLVERVFKVAIATFGSGDSYANVGDPSVPARFLGVIGSIDGLDNFRHSMPLVRRRQSPPEGSSRAHNNLAAPQTIVGGAKAFGPSDLRTFYDENPLLGNGITGAGGDCIAITGDSDYLDAAVSKFDTQFGLPASNITRVVGGGSNKGINSDETEALLDLEWSHAVAPGAAQRYYFSAAGLTDAISSAISDDVCGAINISFSFCGASDSFYTAMDSLFSQAAAQGQSVFISSNDQGAAGLVLNSQGNACVTGSTRNVSELAASPNATGVGGTQYSPTWNGSGNDTGSVPENVWDDSIGASGGGASAIFSKPAYQTGPGVPADGHRDVPDLAMIASPDLPGVFLGGDSSGKAVIDCCWGGTSLSAPIWAGISKLLSQQAGARVGNINSRVYALAASSGASAGLRDVTAGTNTFNQVTGFPAGTGYDQSTGLGTVNLATFVPAFIGATPTPSATPSSTPTATSTPTSTPAPSPTPTSTPISTPSPIPTPVPTATSAPTAAATATPAPSPSPTPTPTPGQSAIPTILSSSATDTGDTGQPYLTMTLPNGVSPGQLLVAVVAIQGSNPVITPWGSVILPAGGWTEITTLPRDCGQNEVGSGPNLAMSIAWRVATPGDVRGTQFTWGFLSNGFFTPVVGTGAIVSIANVNTTNPIEQITPSNCIMQTTTPNAQALVTLNSNDMNLLVYGITGNNSLSFRTGYSLISQHGVFGVGPNVEVDSKLIPVIYTNTGTQTLNSQVAGDSLGYQIDLVAASGSASNAR